MGEDGVYIPDFFEQSLCKNCDHILTRIIEPIDPEDFGLTQEELDELEKPVIEQNTCLIIGMDIMYKVLECNKYKPLCRRKSLFTEDDPLFRLTL